MRSSYIENNYHLLFASLIKIYHPRNVVEFGCLDGFSAGAIFQALNDNGGDYQLRVFDLFDDYQFNKPDLKQLISIYPSINFIKHDYYQSATLFADQEIDFLHIDVSNTADTYQYFIDHLFSKLKTGGLAILEGGSVARDNCQWMVDYQRPKINDYLKTLGADYSYVVLEPHPSLTIFTK